jgi:chorismate dehydratase
MTPFRISAISYLNTAPLLWDFEHGERGAGFEISYTIPSLCAASLEDGSADIGIIPAAAYTSVPDLLILPDVAIAARRAVRSILLVSKVPRDEVRTVALDRSSLTSVALVKVLFARWWGGERVYETMSPDIETMLKGHDAGLLIGDPALALDRSQYYSYDLAEEWIRLTGKPFVFAFWAVRRAALEEKSHRDLASIFRQSRDHGLLPRNLRRIVRDWAPRLALSAAEIQSYLTENIHYFLDPQSLAGMSLFYRYAMECQALPRAPELRFLQPTKVTLVS